MYNRVILVGRLTRDVELRYLPSGSALAKFGLATNRRFKKQDGTNGEEVCFVDITLFGRTAEVANQYLRKGSKVLIEGRLVLETWVDQTGQKRSRHSVSAESMQMLDSKDSSTSSGYDTGYGDMQGFDSYSDAPTYPQQQVQPSQQIQVGGNDYAAHMRQGGVAHKGAQQKDEKEFKIPEIDVDDDEFPF